MILFESFVWLSFVCLALMSVKNCYTQLIYTADSFLLVREGPQVCK